MENFWDSNAWGFFNLLAVLLCSLLLANVVKKTFRPLQDSLMPTSVLGGGLLLVFASLFKLVTGVGLFDTAFFGGNGSATLELLTYHALALGFIASAFKPNSGAMTRERTVEIFNTGVTTVSTYLLQAIFGMVISMIAALIIADFFPAAGILLPFGYGQGTGQALNYGTIFENDFGFLGGKSFGLTIAAMGFVSASIGGVVHLNILRRRGKLKNVHHEEHLLRSEDIESADEIPMQESIDKMTIQIALIALSYLLAYFLMYLLGCLLPGMRSVIYGFNFLLGVLTATLVKVTLNVLKKKGIVKKEYTNSFLMTRACNFFFDIMVVAGIAAIRLSVLQNYWIVILIMGLVGLVVTFKYNHFVAHTLFPKYAEEQFLTMFGMLTGTASTGVILLREIDGDFCTPASDNMVYQNFPAIVFGFPLMLLATLAPKAPVLTLGILVIFFLVMNLILFRSKIFKQKVKG